MSRVNLRDLESLQHYDHEEFTRLEECQIEGEEDDISTDDDAISSTGV